MFLTGDNAFLMGRSEILSQRPKSLRSLESLGYLESFVADVSTWSFGYLEHFVTTRNTQRLSGNQALAFYFFQI